MSSGSPSNDVPHANDLVAKATGTRGATLSASLLDADDPALFPKLTEAQVELLARYGEVRPITVGQVLFRHSGRDREQVLD